ncbi:MAG: hypothetical protein CMB64_02075 [Euryarchaeota archaeon]|nr:hypothetical protein [Euryarchaeota archaeon]
MNTFKCQICGYTKYKILHKQNKFVYGLCKKCSFVSQINLHPKEVYVNLPYQTQSNYEEHSKNRAKYIYDFSKDFIKGKSNFLDIGCSRGGTMKYLKKLISNINITGCTVMGNESMVDSKLNIINKDFNNIKFKSKYDFIIMSHILEHFIDIRSSLKKVYSLMNNDSIAYIEVPWIDYLKVRIKSEYFPEHISYFTPHSLKNLLLTSGYTIVKFKSSKYWGNIKVLVKKDNSGVKKIINFHKNKHYLLYILEKKFRRLTHWFYKFNLKYFNINSND